jgi:uncharacterized protein YndB with AHSA1/START domain
MTAREGSPRLLRAAAGIEASAERVFELIADPAQQPRWDGNDNLKEAAPGQRVRAVGDVFTMRLKRGGVRDNRVVDFVEGRRIAWRPAVAGKTPPGHLWTWELEPLSPSRTLGVGFPRYKQETMASIDSTQRAITTTFAPYPLDEAQLAAVACLARYSGRTPPCLPSRSA